MSYIKKEWKSGDTITSKDLNNIETQIEENTSQIQSISEELEQVFQSVNNGKTNLETAIIDKGGTVSKLGDVATFNELIQALSTITGETQEKVKAALLSSSVDFYEPTDVPNTWVTDSSGKVLNVNTEEFYNLFYNANRSVSYYFIFFLVSFLEYLFNRIRLFPLTSRNLHNGFCYIWVKRLTDRIYFFNIQTL